MGREELLSIYNSRNLKALIGYFSPDETILIYNSRNLKALIGT